MVTLIGGLMLAAPFLIIFGYVVRTDGWKEAFGIFGVTAIVVLWVVGACRLLADAGVLRP